MEPTTVFQQLWAGYEELDLDATWETYVPPDQVIHPASGFELTRESWLAAERQLIPPSTTYASWRSTRLPTAPRPPPAGG
ncbi:hypothetical protein ACIBBB_33530 [Streptomyces sp. NPDC051217]|uniref:hypothetical protein n=1 Tax=Streptomyces sp. NPDC051217 TaxID=3365644 RepID=UPI0037BDA6C2